MPLFTRLPLKLMLVLSLGVLAGCEPQKPAVAEWPHAATGILDAAIARDGKHSLVSSVNFGAAYWDLEKNQLKFQWRQNENPDAAVTSVNLSPDGSRAITADTRTFAIWDTQTGHSIGYWQAPMDIRSVAISDRGKHVLLGLSDGRVLFIDMTSGRRLEYPAHRDSSVASVDLSANGIWAFSGGNDFRAVLWNTQTAQPLRIFELGTRVTKVSLDDQGEQVFTSGTRGNATIWRVKDGQAIARLNLKEREYVISSARFSHNNQYIATGAPGRDVSLWAVKTGKRLERWKPRTRKLGKPMGSIVYAVGFTEQDREIISESSSGFGEKWLITKP